MSLTKAKSFSQLLSTPTGSATLPAGASLRSGYRLVPSSDPARLLPEQFTHIEFRDQFKDQSEFLDVTSWNAKYIWNNDASAPNAGAVLADPTLFIGLILTVIIAANIFGRHDLSSTSFAHQPNFAEFDADAEDISHILAEKEAVNHTVPHHADRIISVKKVRWTL
eukprot:TRINITY_DN1050_c0_g1_i1.p1 TRINITY_DN1050_c0_g1~~TRINITY_DN1050_c0_g1_i1.p1  ORF type:complete len:176 (-),score=37.64 TRINITY_DN1050_c0_g1_i1:37-534(-)